MNEATAVHAALPSPSLPPILSEADAAARLEELDGDLQTLASTGAPPEATLAPMEEALVLRVRLHGTHAPSVASLCASLTEAYNAAALQHLDHGRLPAAYELLSKAETLTEPQGGLAGELSTRCRLRGVTFNNFGCFYKRRGKYHAALHYLERAQRVEQHAPPGAVENAPGTLLNICAVLSKMGRHREALTYAEEAVEEARTLAAAEGGEEGEGAAARGVVAMAQHSVAVESEHLGRRERAAAAYRAAARAAAAAWGEESAMAHAMQQSWHDFCTQTRWGERQAARRGAAGSPGRARPIRPQSAPRSPASGPPRPRPAVPPAPATPPRAPLPRARPRPASAGAGRPLFGASLPITTSEERSENDAQRVLRQIPGYVRPRSAGAAPWPGARPPGPELAGVGRDGGGRAGGRARPASARPASARPASASTWRGPSVRGRRVEESLQEARRVYAGSGARDLRAFAAAERRRDERERQLQARDIARRTGARSPSREGGRRETVVVDTMFGPVEYSL